MSSKSFKWTGSKIFVSLGFGADSPPPGITAISKADPAVVTDAGHALESGDVVSLSGIVGMVELNGKTAIVNVLTNSTFELVGVDSTDYTTYTSGGTYTTALYGNQFCELTSYNRTGSAAPDIDSSSICSTEQETERGLPGTGTVELGYKFAPQEQIQARLNALERSGEDFALMVELPKDGGVRVLLGYVTQTGEQSGNGQLWTGTASIKLRAAPYDVEVV